MNKGDIRTVDAYQRGLLLSPEKPDVHVKLAFVYHEPG